MPTEKSRWSRTGKVVLAAVGGVVVGLLLLSGLNLPTAQTHVAPTTSGQAVPAINACRFAITLTAVPSSTFVGQVLAFQTTVTYRSPGCPMFAAHYIYYGLPLGIVPRDSPLLTGTPQVPGVFHVTVLVYVPWAAPQTASVNVYVMSPT